MRRCVDADDDSIDRSRVAMEFARDRCVASMERQCIRDRKGGVLRRAVEVVVAPAQHVAHATASLRAHATRDGGLRASSSVVDRLATARVKASATTTTTTTW